MTTYRFQFLSMLQQCINFFQSAFTPTTKKFKKNFCKVSMWSCFSSGTELKR